jgi:hypothetical protein
MLLLHIAQLRQNVIRGPDAIKIEDDKVTHLG